MNLLARIRDRVKMAVRVRAHKHNALSSVDSRGGWIPIIYESFAGAWQSNIEIRPEQALAHPTVYACVTQIAADVGKMRLRLMEKKKGIWSETEHSVFSPVLRKPNHYQTRQKFVEQWVLSEVIHGNTYVLKLRNKDGVVIGLYVLDPNRVHPMVAENGEVFYRLGSDNLSRLDTDWPAVPASEIIHDSMECLFHPLVGVPPLFAGGLAAQQGLNIQRNSTEFFGNRSQPGGVLTAPGEIADDTAKRLKEHWEKNYTGENAGRVAVLGDGLKYEPMAVTAVDAQLVDQLKWSDEKICSVFKVPPYKVYVGPMPTYQNAEVLDRIYYSGCLQRLLESIEALLDEGLKLPQGLGTEFDLDDLMRMDMSLRMKTAVDGVGGAIYSPDEARAKFNLPSVPGGQYPYLQQQNYSLAALAQRDSQNPLGKPAPEPPPPASKSADEEIEECAMLISYALHKELRDVEYS